MGSPMMVLWMSGFCGCVGLLVPGTRTDLSMEEVGF